MKIPNAINNLRANLRHLALVLAVGAALMAGIAQAASGPPVAGYTRWFDASTLGLADSAPVTQWTDNSGNGDNATVPSGNATPTYVANAGTGTSLGAIYFAGNGGPASSGTLVFARDSGIRTVFSVFKGNSFLLTDQNAYHFHRIVGP